MTRETGQFRLRSHVSRDFLQSAALFKNAHLVVWEYVANGLQYVDGHTPPVVRVRLDDTRKKISIKDNGRGMDAADLENFFVMHGENLDRKAGRIGRGMFGTGKSAAFGIADRIVLTTTKNGRRTKVSLCRADIEATADGSEIPVRTLERELAVPDPNGTLVEIEQIALPKLDQRVVIAWIEKHLAHWPHHVTVWVNNHECQYVPPTAIRTMSFVPEGQFAAKLGPCALALSVAAKPLSDNERGVSIFSNGVWQETTLAGAEGKDMSNYIFGEIDIPQLDKDKSAIAPFDMSRSMQMNPANEVVQAALAFIGVNVEKLRKELVAEEKRRRESEQARQLAKQADEIAKLINDDFSKFRALVAKARAKARGAVDFGDSEPTGTMGDDDFIFGSQEPTEIIRPTGEPGAIGDGGAGGDQPRNLNPEVAPGREDEPKKGKAAGRKQDGRRRPPGGFSIDFRPMGVEENRAQYQPDGRQIHINLDHPQFKAALGSGDVHDPVFLRLAYEVAFSEYALALAFELNRRGHFAEIEDALSEVLETLNRVARQAASLYQAPASPSPCVVR
ncbi:MAG: ATP-binding protein [Deltaproteobacteria bacterium]|nr:ATP-binding protein [Deltaproteobacteria bacterium]